MSNKTGETLVMIGDNPDGLLSEKFFDQQKNPDTHSDDILGIPNGSRKSPERLKRAGNAIAGAILTGTLLTLGALGHYIFEERNTPVDSNNRPMIEGDTTGEIVTKAGNLTADLCAMLALEKVVPETGVDTHSSELEKEAAQEDVNRTYSNCLDVEFTDPVNNFLETAGLPVLDTYLEFLESNNS